MVAAKFFYPVEQRHIREMWQSRDKTSVFFKVPPGVPVYAPVSGYAQFKATTNQRIKIYHDAKLNEKLITRVIHIAAFHLSRDVSAGERVSKADEVIEWTIQKDEKRGAKIDPLEWASSHRAQYPVDNTTSYLIYGAAALAAYYLYQNYEGEL